MELKNYFPFLMLLIAVWPAHAQTPPPIQWKDTFGGPVSGDIPSAIEKTADGGYILSGFVGSTGCDVSQGYGGWVVKLDSNGLLIWEKTFGGPTWDFRDIRQTTDGGYITTGPGGSGFVVLKLDANGNLAWQQSYTGWRSNAIWQTTDGGYVVVGIINQSYPDILVTRLSGNGNLLWQKTYGGSGLDYGIDIKQTGDGGYIVIGHTTSNNGDVGYNHGMEDIWVLKLFPDGTLDWEQTYGGSEEEFFGIGQVAGNDIIRQTPDGGYVFVGHTSSANGDVAGPLYGMSDTWVVKLHPSGLIDWEENYGGSSAEVGCSIQQTMDGGYIVGAGSFSSDFQVNKNEGQTDVWFFKIDSTGTMLWDWSLGSLGQDPVADIEQISGCEYVVAAWAGHDSGDVSQTCGNGYNDWWVINFKRNLPPPDAPSPQNFCWRELPAIDSLNVMGDTSLGFPVTFNWYDKKTDVVPLAGSTPLTDGEKYFVSQIIDGCESPMDSVVVNIVEDIIPDGPSPQSFCEDDNATIADFQITGQNLLWYQDPNNPGQLPPSTPLQDGETYYVSQTVDNCESSRLGIMAEVFPPPSAFPLSAVVACDTDGNGSGEFFLPDLDDDVSGGATGVTVTYHASLPDAKNGTAPLPDNYSTQTSPQSIYARVLDTATGCDSIIEVELVVSPVPEIMGLEDLIGCDDGNGTAVFDLTENNEAILGSQDPNDLQITYHESQADADNGQNAIPNPENYTSGPRDVFVRLENTETGCFDTGKFKISVNPRPGIANISIDEEFCSDLQGGDFATVDLTVYDDQINPGNPANTQVVYYESPNAYNAGQPIESPESYTTVSNPQILVAEVIDTSTGCPSTGFVEITIHVNDRPVVDLSQYDGRALCWDSDLSTPVIGGNYDPIVLETGLDEDEYSFVWALDGETLPETGSSLEATKPGVYVVAVTDTDGLSKNCSSTSKAEIVEANPPEFNLSRTSEAVAPEHGILVSDVAGAGHFEFSLDDGDWVSLGQDGTVLFEGVAPGAHVVYGKSLEGCGTTAHGITLIGYPRFFTPNSDGFNDRWNIIGLQKGEIYIFDRYGKLLQSLDPQRPGWDGRYNGHPMPSDDYWFRVEFVESLPDGTERKGEIAGSFSLLR